MYVLMDHKWGPPILGTPSGEISWSADLSDLTLSDGATVGDMFTSLTSAFAEWENVAALDFQQSSGSVDIRVASRSFETENTPFAVPGGDQSIDDDAVGLAWIGDTVPGLNEPTQVLIEFNEDEDWSPFADSDPDTVNFFVVAMHEIGHAIGLNHANDATQIMNAFVSASELGDCDKAGAQKLYGIDGDDELIEGVEEEGGEEENTFSDSGGGGGGGGLVLGLLALLFGFLTGGTGFAAVAAAGRIAKTDEDDHDVLARDDHDDHDDHEDDHDDHHHDHNDHEHYNPETGIYLHQLFLPEIPVEEFEHTRPEAEEDHDDLFWL